MASVCIQRISGLFDKMSSKQRGESYEELQLVSRRRLASQLWRGKYPVTADQSLYNTTTPGAGNVWICNDNDNVCLEDVCSV